MGLVGDIATVGYEVSHGSSRLIYGNDAGRANNFGRSRQLTRLRRQAPPPADARSIELADQVHRLGYALVDPAYPAGLIEEIRAGYDRVISDPQACVDMGRPWHHYGNLWHCDQHPITTLKLFVQLSDGVTDEAGAFRFHDVPSTRLIMRAGYLGTGRPLNGPVRRLAEDPRRINLFDAPAGQAGFCNTTRCLHRAGVPLREGATRGMLQVTFGLATERRRAGTDPFAGVPPDANIVEGRFA